MSDKIKLNNIKRLKIVSQGYPHTTRILDNDGNTIDGITKITIELNARDLPKAVIEIEGIEIDTFIKNNQIEIKENAK
jgi:hypothetical protein